MTRPNRTGIGATLVASAVLLAACAALPPTMPSAPAPTVLLMTGPAATTPAPTPPAAVAAVETVNAYHLGVWDALAPEVDGAVAANDVEAAGEKLRVLAGNADVWLWAIRRQPFDTGACWVVYGQLITQMATLQGNSVADYLAYVQNKVNPVLTRADLLTRANLMVDRFSSIRRVLPEIRSQALACETGGPAPTGRRGAPPAAPPTVP